MQGGSGKGGVPLTAYVLLAFLEADEQNPSAVKYLEQNLKSIEDDPYALAITAYALQLAKSDSREDALKLLEKHAITEGTLCQHQKLTSSKAKFFFKADEKN